MDLKDYSYFIALVENKKITKAAEKLYISQPSLSIYLKNLEARLGVKLYNKIGNKIVLTYEGEKYYEYSRKMVSLNNGLLNELKNIKENKVGLVKIGVAPSRSSYITPILYREISKHFPNVKIEVSEIRNNFLIEKIRDGEIDFAFMSIPLNDNRLKKKVIDLEEVVIMTNKNNEISKKAINIEGSTYPHLNIVDIAEEPTIMLERGRTLRTVVEGLYAQEGCVPKIILETQSIGTCLEMVKQNDVLTFSYNMKLAEKIENLVIYTVGNPSVKNQFAICYLDEKNFSNVARDVFDYCYNYMKGRLSTQGSTE